MKTKNILRNNCVNIFPVMSNVKYQTFTFQSVRLMSPNTFHEALQVGHVVMARKMLEQLCHHDLHLELSDTDDNGHNACRIVVERGDEHMFDMLLPFLLPEHFVEKSELDGLSAIQRAVDLNPKWYTKFNVPSITDVPSINSETKSAMSPLAESLLLLEKGDMSPETVYLMMLDLEDMDNTEKYEALWKDFLTQEAEAVSTFILKCLKRKFRKLAWKMLVTRTSSLSASTLSNFMNRGFPLFSDNEGLIIRNFEKFCLLLQAGFFPFAEKLFLQKATRSPLVFHFGRRHRVLEDNDVPTLQTLAVIQIRQALISSQKKSLQFVRKTLLGDVRIPEEFKQWIVQPHTEPEMQLMYVTFLSESSRHST